MPPRAARFTRRERNRIARQESARRARARATQRRQALAALQRDPRSLRRRRVAFALWGAAAALGVVDLLAYVGALHVLSQAAATVLLGGPALVLALAGAMVYGA